jgi:hypothetical protein
MPSRQSQKEGRKRGHGFTHRRERLVETVEIRKGISQIA